MNTMLWDHRQKASITLQLTDSASIYFTFVANSCVCCLDVVAFCNFACSKSFYRKAIFIFSIIGDVVQRTTSSIQGLAEWEIVSPPSERMVARRIDSTVPSKLIISRFRLFVCIFKAIFNFHRVNGTQKCIASI